METRPWHPVANADFSGLEAIIHLAGESILGLWTQGKKDRIRASRIVDTCAMVRRLQEMDSPRPRVLVSAGGSAYYGDRGDALLREDEPPGASFLAEVARAWEAAVQEATPLMRTLSVRIGMVLGHGSGAWPLLRRIYSLGLGGRLGAGHQYMPWIHVVDVARLLVHSVATQELSGAMQGVAPEAVTNATFNRTLAEVLRRPAFCTVPGFLLRHLPGGMGELFLHSQRLGAEVAQGSGFRFLYGSLREAMVDLRDSDD